MSRFRPLLILGVLILGVLILGVLALVAGADLAAAQGRDGGAAGPGGAGRPSVSLPKAPAGDRTRNLDFLFEALKVAPDQSSAKAIEERIWALWVVSGSDTANLLMTRVKAAMEGDDLDLALKLLDAVVEIKPDYVEAWNRRATVYYLKKDFGRALADLRQTLALEPRHFGALSGLGMILQDVGDEKHALEAFRRALAINPRLERIPDLVKTLTEKVEGRDI
jgi:tetratricopeptide (TPR) repeat protein